MTSHQRARRRGLGVTAVAALVLVLAVGWMVWRVVQVRADLSAARDDLASIDVSELDAERAGRALTAAGLHTAAARSASSDPLWRMSEIIPVVGDDLRAVRVVAATADDVATRVLDPLLRTAVELDPDTLRRDDGSVDVQRVAQAAPVVQDASSTSLRLRDELRELSDDRLLAPVADGVSALSTQLDDLVDITGRLATTTRLLPPMMGSEEPRRYFLALQNPAEPRGTGGIVGVYSILAVDDGRLSLEAVGPNDDIDDLPTAPLDLGPDFEALYADQTSVTQNVNLSPHFPYAAQLLLETWRLQTGDELDGVVALDPLAVSYVLEVTGAVRSADGEQVGSDEFVDLTLNTAYSRFGGGTRARKEFLTDLVRAVFEKVQQPGPDAFELTEQLARASSERRLVIYSTREQEQADLVSGGVSGSLDTGHGTNRMLVVNDGGGSKLSYFLDRTITYEQGCLVDGTVTSTLRAVLRNRADDATVDEYVANNLAPLISPATNRLILSAYVPQPAGLRRFTVDGEPRPVATGSELGFAVFVATVDVPPQTTVTVEWEFDEPTAVGHARLLEQPSIPPSVMEVRQSCA